MQKCTTWAIYSGPELRSCSPALGFSAKLQGSSRSDYERALISPPRDQLQLALTLESGFPRVRHSFCRSPFVLRQSSKSSSSKSSRVWTCAGVREVQNHS